MGLSDTQLYGGGGRSTVIGDTHIPSYFPDNYKNSYRFSKSELYMHIRHSIQSAVSRLPLLPAPQKQLLDVTFGIYLSVSK